MDESKSDFEEFEISEEFSNLKTDNLIFEIWYKPKLVFKYLFKHDSNKYVIILLAISAIFSTFDRAYSKDLGLDTFDASYYLSMLVFGSIATLLIYYLSAWLMHYFGYAFLNGKAKAKDFRTVLAWSNIPAIFSIIFTLFLFIIYGKQALSDNFIPPTEVARITYITVAILQSILGIWSMVILVIGIMHIQNFKVWRAIGNLIIPFLLIIIVFLLIFFMADII